MCGAFSYLYSCQSLRLLLLPFPPSFRNLRLKHASNTETMDLQELSRTNPTDNNSCSGIIDERRRSDMSDDTMRNGLRLGFGFMRLPRLADGTTDLELICRMVDRFLEAGGTYFDTAFTYGTDGDSELAIRDAVVKRHPRESFTIATKVNAGKAADEADAKAQFYTSLKRMECGYIDYYLLHGVQIANV